MEVHFERMGMVGYISARKTPEKTMNSSKCNEIKGGIHIKIKNKKISCRPIVVNFQR
jgi:hypothetical protein